MNDGNPDRSVTLEFIALLHARETGSFREILDQYNDGHSVDLVATVPYGVGKEYVQNGVLIEEAMFPEWRDLTPKAQDAYKKALEAFEKAMGE